MVFNDERAVERYFALHDAIEQAVRVDNYGDAVQLAKEAVSLIPQLVRDTKRRFGVFDIVESVAVEKGGRLLAALGDVQGLRDVHATLAAMPETLAWASTIAQYMKDAETGERILATVRHKPGSLQAFIRDSLAPIDPQRVTELCYWLARVGRLKREKSGRSYALFVPA